MNDDWGYPGIPIWIGHLHNGKFQFGANRILSNAVLVPCPPSASFKWCYGYVAKPLQNPGTLVNSRITWNYDCMVSWITDLTVFYYNQSTRYQFRFMGLSKHREPPRCSILPKVEELEGIGQRAHNYNHVCCWKIFRIQSCEDPFAMALSLRGHSTHPKRLHCHQTKCALPTSHRESQRDRPWIRGKLDAERNLAVTKSGGHPHPQQKSHWLMASDS